MIEKLKILHINDLHSHFEAFPKIKRFFAEKSDTGSQVIKLDIGDNVDRSHPMTEVSSGQSNVDLMNELGIDFATIGNNEGIGLAKAELNELYNQAAFKVVLGNLTDTEGRRPAWAGPYEIVTTEAGTKIAFLAYTFPYYWTYAPNGWEVADPLACLQRDLARPEVESADFRILLSHLGIRLDEKIARSSAKIDLIIGAHTHHVFEEGVSLNGTYLAAAGRYGEYVGEIDLTFANHRLSDITILAHETRHLPSLATDKKWLENYTETGRAHLRQQKLADFEHDLSLSESADLLMEAMRAYAKSDLAIVNTGLIVEPFPRNFTKDSLHHSLPHQMRLLKFYLTVQELTVICREMFAKEDLLAGQEIRGMGFRGKRFGHFMTKGFTYKNGKIVYNKEAEKKDGRLTLVLADQYYFATYFEKLKEQRAEFLFPDLLREVLARYLINNKNSRTKKEAGL
ncbi:bifunctional UDP-sugar hydrolase/5'-nucleotidase [Streptococcus sp. H49]|uniref:bifunctional metallophosphatase/5'-nucleotidase n=1 Tax=Streptococcus huangxiaojuni TaxID=3237239 RepID=UPI0034A46E7C